MVNICLKINKILDLHFKNGYDAIYLWFYMLQKFSKTRARAPPVILKPLKLDLVKVNIGLYYKR
ncbi:hypothetical protein JCM12298_28270 [Desulfothermus naphthae]